MKKEWNFTKTKSRIEENVRRKKIETLKKHKKNVEELINKYERKQKGNE